MTGHMTIPLAIHGPASFLLICLLTNGQRRQIAFFGGGAFLLHPYRDSNQIPIPPAPFEIGAQLPLKETLTRTTV